PATQGIPILLFQRRRRSAPVHRTSASDEARTTTEPKERVATVGDEFHHGRQATEARGCQGQDRGKGGSDGSGNGGEGPGDGGEERDEGDGGDKICKGVSTRIEERGEKISKT
ncbi:MAG: hypothetical protein LQ340_006240, partial [Diploschistes diacapsis]